MPMGYAEHNAERGRRGRQEERAVRAVDNAAKHVAAELIGAEPGSSHDGGFSASVMWN